jgi:Intein splicing domain
MKLVRMWSRVRHVRDRDNPIGSFSMAEGDVEFFEKVGTGTKDKSLKRKSEDSGSIAGTDKPSAAGPVPRWSKADDLFWPASETCERLEPGFYRFDSLPSIGACLRKARISIDDLIRLPDSATTEVLAEFSTFWGLKDRFVAHGFLHKRGILLWGPPGCLAADTMIHYQAFVNGQRTFKKDVTIERLYQLFHGLTGPGKGRYQTLVEGTEIRISSVDDEGRIVSNKVRNVVRSGVKPVYRVRTTSGLAILATKDHKFLSNGIYVPLAELNVSSIVEVHANTAINASDIGTQVGRKFCYVQHHPVARTKIINDRYTYKVLPNSRAVVEAAMNNLSREDYLTRLNDGWLEGLVFLRQDQDVHHRDENCTNDELSNLEILDHAEHARLHGQDQSLFFVSSSDEIKSIDLVGEQETYDIEMEAPYHNFVANGFIVHNSGKTASLMLMAQDIVQHHGGIVCQVDHPGLASTCLAHIRKIEPDRPIVALIEDLDALVERHGENQFLSLLDGETQVDRIVFVACPAPETLILKADLSWVRADSLNSGDEIIAFDEHNTGFGRRYRTAQVRSAPLIEKPRYRVVTELGTTVVSEHHPFLVKLGNRPHEWRFVEDLNPGNRIAAIGQPWEPDATWGGGYLAGQFDGEGTLNITYDEESGSHGFRAIWTQATGDVAAKMQQVLDDRGYDIHLYDKKITGKICTDGVTPHKPQISISLADGRWGSLKFIGAIRPVRMMNHPRLKEAWEDARISISCYPKVLSVEPIGNGPVVALDTTTNTFIGDGLLQHNTTNYPERLDKRFVDRPSRFDTIRWIGMPSAAARRVYLEAKEPSLSGEELEQWVGSTDGFSVAHLRELVILVKCFDRPLKMAISRLEAMRLRQPKSNDSPDKPIFGIVGSSITNGTGDAASAIKPLGSPRGH